MSRIDVTFVESSLSGISGGSQRSLLTLLANLDREFVVPNVIFFQDGWFVDDVRDLGIEATVLPVQPPDSTQKDPNSKPSNKNLIGRIKKHIRNGLPGLMAFRHFILVSLPHIRWLFPKIIRLDPDLIHFNNGISHKTLVPIFLGIPFICHERRIKNYDWIQKLLSRKMDVLICNSEKVKVNCVKQGVTGKVTKKIWNAVDLDRFSVDSKKSEFRKSINVDQSDFVITMVANFVEWKRHIDLVKAVNIIKKDIPELVCLIVGASPQYDDSYFSKTKRYIEEFNLQDCFHLLGYRNDVPDILNASDILAHPAENEPFGRVLIEAMFMELPIVATNTGGPVEIVKDGRTGLLVPVNAPEEFARAIKTLYNNSDIRESMGKLGKIRAEKLFTPIMHAEKIEKTYGEIINR